MGLPALRIFSVIGSRAGHLVVGVLALADEVLRARPLPQQEPGIPRTVKGVGNPPVAPCRWWWSRNAS